MFRNALVKTQVDYDQDPIELEGIAGEPDAEDTDRGCVYAIYSLWTWRSRARKKKEERSRECIVQNIEKLNERIALQQAKQIETQYEIAQCVRNKNAVRARRLLLGKKRTQNMIKSLHAYRDELDAVLLSLDESNEQQELVASFKSANRALRSHVGKGASNVEAFDCLADDLQEAQQDVEDLQAAVTSRASSTNDSEIEEELEQLFSEDAKQPPPTAPSTATPLRLPPVPTATIESRTPVPVLL